MPSSPLRVSQFVSAITGITAGTVLSAAWLLYGLEHWRRSGKDQAGRALAAATLVAPQAAPLLMRRIDDPLHDWTRGLKANPAVRLVAVHDKTGRLRSIETDSALLARRAVWSEDVMAGLYAPTTWLLTDQDGVEVCGVMVPIFLAPDAAPVGQLTMAFEANDIAPAAPSPLWGFYLPVMIAAIIAWRVANIQMFKRVVQPFSRLGRNARRADGELPVHRDDQLGDLAKAFSKLHEQVDHWRGEARRLEASLEKKLENQTKDHLKDLRRVTRTAEIDPLTGVNNRRALDNHLERIVADHAKRGLDMALVMIDVDNFKLFNDTLGHPAGDELLSFVGKLLGKSIRQEDLAMRLGGDEFALVLLGATADEAARVARRIAALFGQIVKTLPRMKRPPSLSAGIAGLRETGAASGKDLLCAADEALYQAKESGKGQTIITQPAGSPAQS